MQKIKPVAPSDITNGLFCAVWPVHAFRANDDFVDSKLWRYVGEPTGDFVGHHAMVIIGVRTVEGTDELVKDESARGGGC
jgi:hypothetical protein